MGELWSLFMKLVVDFSLCDSNATCVAVAPDIFEIDENKFLVVHEDKVDESQRDVLQHAAMVCPKMAIRLEG